MRLTVGEAPRESVAIALLPGNYLCDGAIQIYLDDDYVDGSAVPHNFTVTVSFEGPSGWRFDRTVFASLYNPVHGNVGEIFQFSDDVSRPMDVGEAVKDTMAHVHGQLLVMRS